jgi:hypothetical protein
MNTLHAINAMKPVPAVVALALLCSCAATPLGQPEIGEAQKQAIRRAKTAFITVEQIYKNDGGEALADGTSLPFAYWVVRVLALAGISEASAETADITVSVHIEGRELSGSYSYGGFGVGQRRVAGSSLSGEIAIKSGNMKPLRRAIRGGTGLPYSVPSFVGPGPQFQKSFDQSNFIEVLVGILAQTHGIGVLVNGASDSHADMRGICAKALGDLATSAATQPLSKLVHDSHEPVRFTAADALATSPDPNATSVLIGTFEKGNSKTKSHVARCLGRRRDVQAVDALLAQLKGNDSDVSGSCASALGEIGDKSAIDPLIEAMEKPNVRFQARLALKKITGKDLGDEPQDWKKWRQK